MGAETISALVLNFHLSNGFFASCENVEVANTTKRIVENDFINTFFMLGLLKFKNENMRLFKQYRYVGNANFTMSFQILLSPFGGEAYFNYVTGLGRKCLITISIQSSNFP